MAAEGTLLGSHARYLVHIETLVHVLLLQAIHELGHVANEHLVVLWVLRELLKHGIGGDRLLHYVSVDVRGKHELLSRQVSQQLLGNVTSLRDAPAVLKDLHQHDKLVGALQ